MRAFSSLSRLPILSIRQKTPLNSVLPPSTDQCVHVRLVLTIPTPPYPSHPLALRVDSK